MHQMHDRVLVTGELPALPPPPPPTCDTLSDVARLQCLCAREVATGACAGADIPGKIVNPRARACSLIDAAAGATGKPRRKKLGKALARLRNLPRLANKRGVRKRLPDGCGDALVAALTELRDATAAVRKAQ